MIKKGIISKSSIDIEVKVVCDEQGVPIGNELWLDVYNNPDKYKYLVLEDKEENE